MFPFFCSSMQEYYITSSVPFPFFYNYFITVSLLLFLHTRVLHNFVCSISLLLQLYFITVSLLLFLHTRVIHNFVCSISLFLQLYFITVFLILFLHTRVLQNFFCSISLLLQLFHNCFSSSVPPYNSTA